ncbi:hypothetical protein AB990_07445, partial [Alkalihalobacillus pseudalcaliphilus]
NEKFIIPFEYLDDILPVDYTPRDKLIEEVVNIGDVDFEYDNFDYPLENIHNSIEISNVFNSQLDEYENVLIINFNFLESKILELKNFYNGLDISFDSSKILRGICDRIKNELGIDNIKILLFSNRYEFFIDKIPGLELYLNGVDSNFKLFCISFLFNYYLDDKYYHLNKIIIFDDSSNLNDIFEILPDYNSDRNEADIFMIRNQNSESQVSFSPYYYNADRLISEIVGLSDEAMGLWDPTAPKKELSKLAEYLNLQIESSKSYD